MNLKDFYSELHYSLRFYINNQNFNDDLNEFKRNISAEDIYPGNTYLCNDRKAFHIQTGLGNVDPNDLAEVLDDFGVCQIQISTTDVIELDDCDLIVGTVISDDTDDMKLIIKTELYDDMDFYIEDIFNKPFFLIEQVKKGTGSKYKFKNIVEEQIYITFDEVSTINYDIHLENDYPEEDEFSEYETVTEAEEDEEIIVPGIKRCAKHNWAFYGQVVPYKHLTNNNFLGHKSKEVCVNCGSVRWKNITTGSNVKQKSQDD